MAATRRTKPALFLFPLFAAAAAAAVWAYREPLFAVFSSAERVRAAVERAGAWGPALFMALQVLQVVVFVVPGELVQVAGGWLFGTARGTVYSLVGIGLGSLVNFSVARFLGRGFVESLFGPAALSRFESIARSRRSAAAFFLFFVIPGIPKDALCFVAGLSPMRAAVFLSVSLVGRLPGILGSSVMGRAASEGRYGLLIGVAAAAAVLFALGVLLREPIQARIAAIALSAKARRREGA